MKLLSTFCIGLMTVFFSHLLLASSALLPGTHFVAGDLNKGEFYIVANNESVKPVVRPKVISTALHHPVKTQTFANAANDSKVKIALQNVLHRPIVVSHNASKKTTVAHKTEQRKWQKTKVAFHQHHKKRGVQKDRKHTLALNKWTW